MGEAAGRRDWLSAPASALDSSQRAGVRGAGGVATVAARARATGCLGGNSLTGHLGLTPQHTEMDKERTNFTELSSDFCTLCHVCAHAINKQTNK